MPPWKGKSKGTRLGYRIFVWLCKYVGVFPAYCLLVFVSLYYFLFSFESSKHIYHYFRFRHGFSAPKAFFSIYISYYVFGQTLIDRIVITSGFRNKFTFHFDGRENLEAIVARGKGGILISAHIGNWEVAGHFLEHLHTRVHVVMFDGEHKRIKAYLDQVTGGRTFNVIVIKDDMSHVYQIGEALRRNELVCLHGDRFMEGNKTLTRKFLDHDARFPVGPFALAAVFKVPVSFVFAVKESLYHYHLFGSKIIDHAPEISRDAYTELVADRFLERLHAMVNAYRYQWFNYYKFWND